MVRMIPSLLLLSFVGVAVSAPGYHHRAYSYRPAAYTRPFTAVARTYGNNAPVDYKPDLSVILDAPNANAALAYIAEDLGSCGEDSQVYIKTLITTGDEAAATRAADAIYRAKYFSPNYRPSAPCLAAENAWKAAYATGQSPTLTSALAFIDAYPGGGACKASARAYIQAILQGKTSAEASLASFADFAAASTNGIDTSCAKAAMAYIDNSGAPATPIIASMRAFMAQALKTGQGLDPVCRKSALNYAKVIAAGGSQEEANEAAAVDYLNALATTSFDDENSPCAVAGKAFIDAYEG